MCRNYADYTAISNKAGLVNIRDNPAGKYYLTTDIDFAGGALWDDSENAPWSQPLWCAIAFLTACPMPSSTPVNTPNNGGHCADLSSHSAPLKAGSTAKAVGGADGFEVKPELEQPRKRDIAHNAAHFRKRALVPAARVRNRVFDRVPGKSHRGGGRRGAYRGYRV